jgi:hypothetical protein
MTRRSRTWHQLLSDALAGVYPALEAMTDAELRIVSRARNRVTTTNCWWLAYECAPHLGYIADLLPSNDQGRSPAP